MLNREGSYRRHHRMVVMLVNSELNGDATHLVDAILPSCGYPLVIQSRVHVIARGTSERTVLEGQCTGEMMEDAGYAPR
jgi:hypothetical protein